MVGIDGEDDPEKVRRFVEKYGIESPAVNEPDLGHSTAYVLDGDYRVVGAHSEEAL